MKKIVMLLVGLVLAGSVVGQTWQRIGGSDTAQKAPNGYTTLPSGLTIQWGTNASNGSGYFSPVYQKPFSFATYSVTCTANYGLNNGACNVTNGIQGPAPSITGFTGYIPHAGIVINWIAIGY